MNAERLSPDKKHAIFTTLYGRSGLAEDGIGRMALKKSFAYAVERPQSSWACIVGSVRTGIENDPSLLPEIEANKIQSKDAQNLIEEIATYIHGNASTLKAELGTNYVPFSQFNNEY
jgi:hypothetical protein